MDPLIKEMHRLQETGKLAMEYSEIWKWGNKISGGWGFWGSHALLDHNNPKEMVKAWVDALRDKGYTDFDIVLYGDWRDGRHLADDIAPDMSYATFKQLVSKYSADPKAVAEENAKAYADKFAAMKKEFGVSEEPAMQDEAGELAEPGAASESKKPKKIKEAIDDKEDLEDRLDALEEAREGLEQAIEAVETAISGTDIESNIDAYFLAPLKIMASSEHGYLSKDLNIDEIKGMLEDEFAEQDDTSDDPEEQEGYTPEGGMPKETPGAPGEGGGLD